MSAHTTEENSGKATSSEKKGTWLGKAWWILLLVIPAIIYFAWIHPWGNQNYEVVEKDENGKIEVFNSEVTLKSGETKKIYLPKNLADIAESYMLECNENVSVRQVGTRKGKPVDETWVEKPQTNREKNVCEGAVLYITNKNNTDCRAWFKAWK
jgi:hypothetical protein